MQTLTGKFCGMLGLCAKAGKITYGAFGCEKGIKSGKIKLVVISAQASENTKKEFSDSCKYYNIPIIFSDEDIGKAVGKSANKVFGITDADFAKALIKKQSET